MISAADSSGQPGQTKPSWYFLKGMCGKIRGSDRCLTVSVSVCVCSGNYEDIQGLDMKKIIFYLSLFLVFVKYKKGEQLKS